MPFKKGQSGNASGRPIGAENKSTTEIRTAFKKLLDDNSENMLIWLERVAATDPDKALTICASLAEFIIPKLARTETKHEGEVTLKSVKVDWE